MLGLRCRDLWRLIIGGLVHDMLRSRLLDGIACVDIVDQEAFGGLLAFLA
jgi:hypothetical protein